MVAVCLSQHPERQAARWVGRCRLPATSQHVFRILRLGPTRWCGGGKPPKRTEVDVIPPSEFCNWLTPLAPAGDRPYGSIRTTELGWLLRAVCGFLLTEEGGVPRGLIYLYCLLFASLLKAPSLCPASARPRYCCSIAPRRPAYHRIRPQSSLVCLSGYNIATTTSLSLQPPLVVPHITSHQSRPTSTPYTHTISLGCLTTPTPTPWPILVPVHRPR